METAFDRGIRLASLGDGRYRALIEDRWWIDRGPNGGFLAGVILNSLMHEVDDRDRRPRSLTVHYLDRPVAGAIELEPTIERSGRSFTATTARMYQEGKLLATAQCAFSRSRSSDGWSEDPFPAVPPAEKIPNIEVPPDMLPAFAQNFDYRFALGSPPYAGAESATIGAWVRLREPRIVDAPLIATLADGLPPAVFSRATSPTPIPTIDLTVHFRSDLPRHGASPGDWCLARFNSTQAADGFVEENGVIWSTDGTLLAQSRQLALYITERANRDR